MMGSTSTTGIDVVVLTDERYVRTLTESEALALNESEHMRLVRDNVMLEDQMITDELVKRGLTVKKVAWSDQSFDWSTTKYALFRSTWDYAERLEEFHEWLKEVSTKTTLINSHRLISWNLDKHYLQDLSKTAGIHVAETYFIEPDASARTLKEVHEELGWNHTVLKPCISASAKDTYRLESTRQIESVEEKYQQLLASGHTLMLQPFQESIVKRGEVSLVMINGEFTHGVLKVVQVGDFRVQDDFGGTVQDYEPTVQEVELAKRTVQACQSICGAVPLYARVDMINDNGTTIPALMEIELIEPEMWFRKCSECATKLADAIQKLF